MGRRGGRGNCHSTGLGGCRAQRAREGIHRLRDLGDLRLYAA